MGKKKSFIDKKKAATFSLVFRDSSEAQADGDDGPERVFVRSDGREDRAEGGESRWGEGSEISPQDERYSDGEEEGSKPFGQPWWAPTTKKPLPEHVRKEILEMGFPDDGYDYMQHLRELRGGGVGAIAVTPELQLRADVRAYNARSVRVKPSEDDELLAEVEAATGVKPIVKVGASILDPDVLKLLEDSASEDEEESLEDDFVIAANEAGDDEEDGTTRDGRAGNGAVRDWLGSDENRGESRHSRLEDFEGSEDWSEEEEEGTASGSAKKAAASSIASDVKNRDRPTRLLDEQFDNLAVREYDSDDSAFEEADDRGQADISHFDSVLDNFLEDQDIHPEEYHTLAEEQKARATLKEKASGASKDNADGGERVESAVEKASSAEESIRQDSKQDAPSTSGREAQERTGLDIGEDEDSDVLGELREKEEVIWVDEDDEREEWDCDTIVSTYSNLDNHPGRIGAPPNKFKALGSERGGQTGENAPGLIRLSGKQGLPLEYLPKRGAESLLEDPPEKRGPSQKVAGPRAGEGKEEKKARKAALKEQRRESRVVKRDMKALYKAEAQKAIQKAAAAAGAPQGIRLP